MEAHEEQGTHIVVVGNPFDGMQIWGPFDSALCAAEWARENEEEISDEWRVVPVWKPA